MVSVYAGESYAKRLARAIVYCDFIGAEFWEHQARGHSFLITLTGDEAAEAGLFQSMGVPQSQCVFVDRKEENTETARRRSPDSISITANVVDVLRAFPGSIGLVHLDFMGAYTESTKVALEACALKVRPGGFVIWTFLRGRETESNRFWKLAKQVLKSGDPLGLEPDPWQTRKTGYNTLALEALNRKLDHRGPTFVPAGSLDYDSGKSPMGMLVFKKAFQTERDSKHKAVRQKNGRALMKAMQEVFPDITLRGDAKAEVRRRVCCPCCLGKMPAKILGGLLNLKESTIIAWRAHFTMGTYDKEKKPFWMITQRRYRAPCPGCATAAEAEAMGVAINQLEIDCSHRNQKILATAPKNKYTRRGRAAWRIQKGI